MSNIVWQGLRRHARRIAGWDGAPWIASIVVVLAVGSVLSWVFWDWLHDDRESVSSTVRNLGLVIGAVIAALLAVWRSRVAERQAHAARRQVETAERGLLSERFQRGTEMLGSDVLMVRLGGIDALKHLADEHPHQYHIQIMQLLCAFVRHPTEHEEIEVRRDLRQDIQSALHAISDCHRNQSEIEYNRDYRLELQNSNISYGLLANLDLSQAYLIGADLSHSFLTRTDLSGADLSHANLRSTNLADATLIAANIWSADLTGTDLRGANLYRANLVGLNLSQCNLNSATLCRALLSNVDVSSADISDSDCSRINAQSAMFINTNLRRANLSFAGLDSANMRAVRLDSSNLYSAVLFGADLSGASLRRANVCNGNLRDADLSNADLSEALFSEAGEHPATGITQTQLDEARADPASPPQLDGVLDADTGKQLVWRGEPPNDTPA